MEAGKKVRDGLQEPVRKWNRVPPTSEKANLSSWWPVPVGSAAA